MSCNYDADSISIPNNYQEWTTGYIGNQPSDCDACYGYYSTVVPANNAPTNATTDGLGNPYSFWKTGYPATGCGGLLIANGAGYNSEFANNCGLSNCDYYQRSDAFVIEAGEKGKVSYFICTENGWVDKTSDAINPYLSNIADIFIGYGTIPYNSGGSADPSAMCCHETYNGPSITYNTLDYDLKTSYRLSFSCVYWTGASPAGNCAGDTENGCCNLSVNTTAVQCLCADAAPSGYSYGACVSVEYGQEASCDKGTPPAGWDQSAGPSTTGDPYSYSCTDVQLSSCPPADSLCGGLYFWRTGKVSCAGNDCEAQMNASDSSETP